MLRLMVCGLLATAFTGAARAGELDRETGPAPAGPVKAAPATLAGGSELDEESPAQSHYWRRGWYGRPYRWGGGYASVSFGWGGGGFYSPWGWGYSRSFYSYPAFYGYRGWSVGYSPAYWGGGWGGGWGGWGCGW